MRASINVLIWICLCCLSTITWAQESDYIQVKDMSDDWYVYDKYYQKFVPQVEDNIVVNKAGVFIGEEFLQDGYLSFYATNGLTCFIDNQLIYKYTSLGKGERVYVPIKQLAEVSSQKPLFVLFYHPRFQLFQDSLEVSLPITPDQLNSLNQKSRANVISAPIQIKNQDWDQGVMILLIVILVGLLIFYKHVLLKGGQLLHVGIDRSTELMLSDKSGSLTLYLVVLNAFLYTLIFYVAGFNGHLRFNIPFWVSPLNMNATDFVIYVFLFLTGVQLLKLVYVKMLNEFTFDSGVSSLENYIILNYLYQLGLVWLIIILLIKALWPGVFEGDAKIIAVIFYLILILVSLLASYMIFVRSELKNVYLFSYICTAELVPISIAYRILLG
ncbi:MAG: DUF4271 domain-containing protein [Cytophagaceae bacterium]